MKFAQVFSKILFLLKVLTCETTTTYRSRLANRRQQKLIEGSMDMEADPCEDFYQYACGNWENLHREAGDMYYETVSLLDYKVNKELSRVFNRINFRYQPKFVKSAYEYYKSCKDLTIYETWQYVKWITENENIHLPLFWTTSKTTVDFDWLKTLAVMRTYGLNNVFIEETVMARRDDPSKYIIDLDKPVSDGGFQALTYEGLKLLVEASGLTMTTRTFSQLWSEVNDFELQLMDVDEVEDYIVEEEEDIYNERDLRLTTVKDLPFSWLKEYLRIILNQTTVNPNMEIYIQNLPYMMSLDELLKQYTQRFLCKYLELRFLQHLYNQTPKNFLTIDCVGSARRFLPMAINWLYEQQHPELKQEFPKITELFVKIKKHFNTTIFNNYYGFNASVVEFLSAKLKNMQLKINNLPRIDTVHTLEKFYKSLHLNGSEFYANHLRLLKFDFAANHNLLNLTIPQKDYFYLENWEFGGTSTSYFIRSSNILVVPLTLLQQPISHVDLDNTYKYSSLGFLLAREFFHGFDDIGLQFDHKGKITSQYDDIIRNPLYNASVNCLLELNPPVLDEKIVDVSSLPIAYHIFLNFYPDAPTEYRRLYGRDISLSKLFFLNFAQFFCGASNAEDFISQTEHGSDRSRINDILSQFPEFSKIYRCGSENHMHLNKTCHMWSK